MAIDDSLVRRTLEWASDQLSLVVAELAVTAALVRESCAEAEGGTSLAAATAALETAHHRVQRLLRAPRAERPV